VKIPHVKTPEVVIVELPPCLHQRLEERPYTSRALGHSQCSGCREISGLWGVRRLWEIIWWAWRFLFASGSYPHRLWQI